MQVILLCWYCRLESRYGVNNIDIKYKFVFSITTQSTSDKVICGMFKRTDTNIDLMTRIHWLTRSIWFSMGYLCAGKLANKEFESSIKIRIRLHVILSMRSSVAVVKQNIVMNKSGHLTSNSVTTEKLLEL